MTQSTPQSITQNILTFYSNVAAVVNGLVSLLVGMATFAMAEVTPVLAPIPALFSIYRALTDTLAVPHLIGLLAAITLEITSMYTAKTAIRAYQWNQQRTAKGDPVAPFYLSLAMAVLFYLVILVLALAIEILPSAAVLMKFCLVQRC